MLRCTSPALHARGGIHCVFPLHPPLDNCLAQPAHPHLLFDSEPPIQADMFQVTTVVGNLHEQPVTELPADGWGACLACVARILCEIFSMNRQRLQEPQPARNNPVLKATLCRTALCILRCEFPLTLAVAAASNTPCTARDSSSVQHTPQLWCGCNCRIPTGAHTRQPRRHWQGSMLAYSCEDLNQCCTR